MLPNNDTLICRWPIGDINHIAYFTSDFRCLRLDRDFDVDKPARMVDHDRDAGLDRDRNTALAEL